MKKLIIVVLYCFISFNSSCRSGQCSNPKECEYPDRSVAIKAVLSNTDSVLHVGDTLRFYARVPDTLITKELPALYGGTFTNQSETIFVKSFYKKEESRISVELISGDTALRSNFTPQHKDSRIYNIVDKQLVKFGGQNQNIRYIPWKLDTREFECFFILKYPGHYYLRAENSYFAVTATDKRNWMLYTYFNFFDRSGNLIKPRYNQFLKLVDSAFREEAQQKLQKNTNWYFFEVKP